MNKTALKSAVALVVGAYADSLNKASVVMFQSLTVFAKDYGPMTEKAWDSEVRPVFEAEIKAKNCAALSSQLSQIKVFVIAKSHSIVPITAVEGRSLDTVSGYVAAARKPLLACKSARMTVTGRNSNGGNKRSTIAKRAARQPVAVAKTFDRNAFESMAGFLLPAPAAKALAAVITDTNDRGALVKWLASYITK